MEKRYVTDEEVRKMVGTILSNITRSSFGIPHVVVPIVRGGTVPGTMISHYYDIPMQCVHWSTRDNVDGIAGGKESNAWLPELALEGTKILIVDDILDTGRTIEELKDDWQRSVRDPIPWDETVRVAALHQRHSSSVDADYCAEIVEDDAWIVYPWEMWG